MEVLARQQSRLDRLKRHRYALDLALEEIIKFIVTNCDCRNHDIRTRYRGLSSYKESDGFLNMEVIVIGNITKLTSIIDISQLSSEQLIKDVTNALYMTGK